MGLALTGRGEADAAIVHYRKALESEPDNAKTHFDLGVVLAARGQVDQAIAQYEKALAINPDYAKAHSNLGATLASRGRIDDAIVHYRRAVEISPDNLGAHYNLGLALAGRGQLGEAASEYQQVLRISPNNIVACNSLAWIRATHPNARFRNGAEAVTLGATGPGCCQTIPRCWARWLRRTLRRVGIRRRLKRPTKRLHSHPLPATRRLPTRFAGKSCSIVPVGPIINRRQRTLQARPKRQTRNKLVKEDFRMFRGKKVVVVMPAYNAARTLKRTYDEVMAQEIVDLVIVVDDASKDDTAAVARTLPKVTLHIHPTNQGYGANQKTCYRLALEAGGDIVIMIHPDYQYTPQLIPAMAAMAATGLYPCVLGSRILGGYALQGGMPWWKYLSNRVLTAFENVVTGAKLSEYHTGYRAFSRELLESLSLEPCSDNFVFDNQMLAQILWLGATIAEVSCPTRYEPESSSINFSRSTVYGLGCLQTVLAYRLAKMRLIGSPLFPPEKHGRWQAQGIRR